MESVLDRILRGLEERRKIVGDFELNVSFRFGGTPMEVAEEGLKLFAKEVIPVLKTWKNDENDAKCSKIFDLAKHMLF